MAKALWGNVYYYETYAGRLEEQPGGRCIFTYDQSYLDNNQPAIAYTLPLGSAPIISERGLHPYFDNLIAEGWFRNAQARALSINPSNKFALLLGFGRDLAGAVSVIDPEPARHHDLDHSDEATLAALRGRASLSGVQRKLLMVREGQGYRPVRANELSTHIAKLASGNLHELLELEYLTTAVVHALLPDDDIVDVEFTALESINENGVVIPRFDRSPGGKRIHHFEEFNQLLGHYSGDDKYEGDYADMGRFILNTELCVPAEAYRLFLRILVCLLVGNTDAHFKNFAMFHTKDGLRLTPAYDLVASAIYPEFQSIALQVCGIRNLQLGKLDAKHIIKMSENFGVSHRALMNAIEALKKNLPNALMTLENAQIGSLLLRTKLQGMIEKRWNGSFELIGKRLSKKQNSDENNKD
jgi:serine/threonine-protein kinase HipA